MTYPLTLFHIERMLSFISWGDFKSSSNKVFTKHLTCAEVLTWFLFSRNNDITSVLSKFRAFIKRERKWFVCIVNSNQAKRKKGKSAHSRSGDVLEAIDLERACQAQLPTKHLGLNQCQWPWTTHWLCGCSLKKHNFLCWLLFELLPAALSADTFQSLSVPWVHVSVFLLTP